MLGILSLRFVFIVLANLIVCETFKHPRKEVEGYRGRSYGKHD